MDVNYKILCEVKLLHEYYLTNKDGSTIFDLPAQADRLAYLQDRYHFSYPSASTHLDFLPAEPLKELFDNYKIRIIPSYSGFKVFISVKEQMLPGNIKGYRPAHAVADDLPIIIQLRNKSSFIDDFSNSGIRKPVPATYYFTNRDLGAGYIPPTLSQPVPLKNEAPQTEQGELSLDTGDHKIKALFFEKNGTKNWMEVKGTGYVNAADRLLLPTHFRYHFEVTDGITEANFVLKDAGNNTVSSIDRISTSALKNIELDYTPLVPAVLDETHTPTLYTLEVTGSNGYQRKHSILFHVPALVPADTWGLVHLQPRVADPAYQLLGDDGLLKTRRHADGTIESAPVFELRIKSRFLFWRYRNIGNKKILDNASLHPLLNYDPVNGIMESSRMFNASYTPIEFLNMGSTQYLPNPDADSPLVRELERIYTDIRVPRSELFKI